jgi:hypothetical protein
VYFRTTGSLKDGADQTSSPKYCYSHLPWPAAVFRTGLGGYFHSLASAGHQLPDWLLLRFSYPIRLYFQHPGPKWNTSVLALLGRSARADSHAIRSSGPSSLAHTIRSETTLNSIHVSLARGFCFSGWSHHSAAHLQR